MECSQADGFEEISMRTQGRRDVGRVALDILVDLEEILCIRRSRDHVLVRVDDERVEDGVNGTGSVERHGRVLRFGVLSFSDGATNRHNFKLNLTTWPEP